LKTPIFGKIYLVNQRGKSEIDFLFRFN